MKKKVIIVMLVILASGFTGCAAKTDSDQVSKGQLSQGQEENNEKPKEELKGEKNETPKEEQKTEEKETPKEELKAEEKETPKEEPKIEEKEEKKQGPNLNAIKSKAETIINKEIKSNVKDTKVTSVTVNENLGTESNHDDAIVLANLSWSVKNGEKNTRSMIEMYSDHLATLIAETLADKSEIALFWKAEYTGLNIKHSYYVKGGKAYRQ